MVANVFFRHRAAWFTHHEQLHLFAHSFIGYPNDSALHHARHTGYHVFHLIGVHIKAADQNHVLLAVHNFEVAFFVHHPNIPRAEVAICRGAARGFVFTQPIACHHLRAFNSNFATLTQGVDFMPIVIDQLHHGARHGHTDSTCKSIVGYRVAAGYGAGFRQTIALANRTARAL